MKNQSSKPEKLHEQHLEYLDALRESGSANMYGAWEWLKRELTNLSREEAREIVLYWMRTFTERQEEK